MAVKHFAGGLARTDEQSIRRTLQSFEPKI